MPPLVQDFLKIAATAAVGLTGGLILRSFGAPAPFMLGSLFGAWFVGALIHGFAPHLPQMLGTPRWFHKAIVLGLAALIGGSFSLAVLEQAFDWWQTVLLMIVASVVATLLGMAYLRGLRRQPYAQALLSALPGGQADIVAIAGDYTDKDYLVALVHLCRVVTVFVAMPLMLAFTQGPDGVAESYRIQDELPTLANQSAWTLLILAAVGGFGFLGARFLRIPMPHLLGPLLLSAALHLSGLIELPRLAEFVLIAQVFIAGTIGARLSRVPMREVMGGLADGVVTAFLLIGTFVVIALLSAWAFDLDLIQLILAFIPGGLYEVTLLAMLFGFDLAFVAFHHTVRILLVFFSMPWLLRARNTL